MRRMWPILSLAVTMCWCPWARASDGKSTPTHCEQPGLSNKELVLCGIAGPDVVLFRVPEGIAAERFVNALKPAFGEWKKISDRLYAFHLPNKRFGPPAENQDEMSLEMTLEEKAEQVDVALHRLDAVKEIGLVPGDFIPFLLKGVIARKDIVILEENPGVAASPLVTESRVRWETSNAEPDLYLVASAAPPGDPGYAQQCGLKAIHAEDAWKTITDAAKVTIAIVDSGVDGTHPDLAGNVVKPDDVDENGHGTHLAGIVGGIKNNKGIVGVTWTTNITAYRFLDASGRGTLEDAIPAIDRAISGNPQIILLAWGVAKGSLELETVLLKANKMLLVTAAGNSGQDTEAHPVYPASYPLDNLISVMATTCDDVRPRFSNFGKNKVDLAAPGEGLSNELRIYSSVLHHKWGHLAGTSMSAAFVAGAAALVFESNPWATPQQVKCWLNKSVDQIPGLENKSGGRLNLAKAVKPLDPTACP